jgi:cupin 2 domain-containing protein
MRKTSLDHPTIKMANLFADIPRELPEEHVAVLLSTPRVRIERIVSRGHASPPDFWYDQEQPEWVVVLTGAGELQFEGETAPRRLQAGDYIHIPAHARHRVVWADPNQTTVWLAIHHE